MGFSDWTWDILNISLFFKGDMSDFPESKKGKTFFLNSSNVKNVRINHLHSYLKILTGNLSKEVLETIEGRNYDFILISAPELIFLIGSLRANFKARVKVFVHDLGIQSYHPYSIFFRNSIGKTIAVDEILADSEKTSTELEKFLKSHRLSFSSDLIKIAWLTIDYNQYRKISKQEARKFLSLPENIPIFLSVGSPSKNLKNVIKALNLINLEDFNFLRIGRIPVELSALMSENLKSKTRIAMNVKDEEMLYYYNAADLLLFPSILEGFGLEILEAIACEVPVLIADFEPMRTIAGKCALKIKDPNNQTEMRDVLSEFISNKELFLKECDYNLIKSRFNNEKFIKIIQE